MPPRSPISACWNMWGPFLPRRDVHDERIVAEVESGTATYGGTYGEGLGIIDSQETVGGWPNLAA